MAERFQSAPLTDVRGDVSVDIVGDPATGFQSAPLTDVRGDLLALAAEFVWTCFNPLPSLM